MSVIDYFRPLIDYLRSNRQAQIEAAAAVERQAERVKAEAEQLREAARRFREAVVAELEGTHHGWDTNRNGNGDA